MKSNEKTKQIDLNFFKKHNYEKYTTNQPFFNGIILPPLKPSSAVMT